MMPRLAGPLALCCALSACFADNYVYQGPTSTEATSGEATSTGAEATSGEATGTGAGASTGAETTLIESSGSSTGSASWSYVLRS